MSVDRLLEEEVQNKVDTDWAKMGFKDGVVYATYKAIDVDLDAAEKVTEERKKLHEGISALLICDVSQMKSVSKEARTYFSVHGSESLKATAMIIASGFNTMLANFFMRVNFKKPPVPTKVFTNIEDAKKWVEQYR